MKKIAILGCENSHADAFLGIIYEKKLYTDVECVGVYSEDREAADKLNEKYGVRVMAAPDELVGQLDGLIITARHGGKHHEFARPYISSGIPMFIDKPITIDEADGIALMRELRENGVRFCGGSSCPHAKFVRELKADAESGRYGKIIGGSLRAPVSIENPHGGWYFYSQHLVEVMCELFGYYPESVRLYKSDVSYDFVVKYPEYNVFASFVDGNYVYAASLSLEKGFFSGAYSLDGCYESEFECFHKLLLGGESEKSHADFIAPVFIMNAMARSLVSRGEEKVVRFIL